MLEGLSAWVLNTYIGEYVENLNTHQLSIALLQGAVELENLPLKKDALKSLGLPLQVNAGFIGKIKLQIPLRRLHSEPWVISIEKLYLVAGPLTDNQYDEKKENEAEAAWKEKLLKALETKMQLQKSEPQETSSWFSYGTSIAANLLENVQLIIKDVHIRYEDDVTNPSCPFSFGIVIKELSAQSTDGSWVPKFVHRDEAELMHKLVDLKNLALYFDTNTTLIGNMDKSQLADTLQREMYVSSVTDQFMEHEYILSPVSATAKMKRYTSALPLRKTDMPRNTIDLNLHNMAFSLSEAQYRCIMLTLKEFDQYKRRQPFKKWRPTCPVKNNAHLWWKFALEAHLSTIRKKNERCTWPFVLQRARDNVLYCRVYKLHMKKLYLDAKVKSHLSKVETEYSFDEIKILREIVFKKLSEEEAELLSRSPSPESQTIKEEAGNQERKSLLQNWFPGWGGWYGNQPQAKQPEQGTSTESTEPEGTQEEVGLEPKISKSELEQELSHVIEDVIGDSDADKSVLTRDTVFAKLIFHLDTGSFKVQGTKTHQDTGDTESYSILEMECSAINMLFESRPRTRGMTFGLNVGGLVLLDKLTESTLFPCLVASKNKDKFGVKLPSGGLGYQKSSRIPSVTEDAELKLFELLYEKNPIGMAADYRFVVVTKPLDIVYNMTAFRKVRKIFSSKNIYASRKSEVSIAAAARRQYETVKRQTKAEFKQSLTQLLEGSEENNAKKWDIRLDISAPQIIVPESFSSESTRLVVMDLGHLKCHNTQSPYSSNTASDGNNEDEFLTPLSTPPSEAEDQTSPTPQKPDLSLDFSEAQVYKKLYDQYTLELTDIQVMVGRMTDNWRNVQHRNSTPLHLVDRFSISLQLERRLIYTTDPQWPTLIVSATLPSLTVHVNEHKIQTINNCIQSLTEQDTKRLAPDTMSSSLASSFSQHSLQESPSTGTLEDLEEAGEQSPHTTGTQQTPEAADRHMRQLLEESQLLRMQFAINRISLEIHSRDRAVAELQVAGVRTDLTKRPYDMAMKFTLHSLIVVDALQMYGPDFELLAASHKNITLDSTSGSIRDSATTSPVVMSPGYPPGSPLELHAPQPGTFDVVSKAFQALISKGYGYTQPDLPEKPTVLHPAETDVDSEALITLEFERINANSPSNTSSGGPLNIANFAFNNLDLIANQETLVEIVSFMKRTLLTLKKSKSSIPDARDMNSHPKSTLDLCPNAEVERARLEVTAEFNRLSVLLMRLDDSQGVKVARKVATATVSAARLQATIDTELSMSGSIGGFHIFDITPDVKRHQRLFSVGHDLSQSQHARSVFTPADMYTTANESLLLDEGGETKALTFHFSKPLKKYSLEQSHILGSIEESDEKEKNCINISLKMASLCYTHSPKTLAELSHCVSEFKEYRVTVAKSLKNVASEVAKGMVAKRSDFEHNSNFGSTASLDMFPSLRNLQKNRTCSENELEDMDTVGFLEPEVEANLKIVLDASLDSPVIVIPKSATSGDVLVAHLGQISLRNKEVENISCSSPQADGAEFVRTKESAIEKRQKPDCIIMKVQDMNLCSMNLDAKGASPEQFSDPFKLGANPYYPINTDQGSPIMHNTTIDLVIDHYARRNSVVNTFDKQSFDDKDVLDSMNIQELPALLDMKAKIQTPLKLELSKKVYEQILQTTDYISSASEDEIGSVTESTAGGTAEGEESEVITPTAGPRAMSGTFESKDSLRQNSSSSQLSVQFITKKFNFEVPLFTVVLGGDFGEGERGVVELKLHQFVLDFTKDNPATSKVNLSLKSLEMEDLFQEPDSPHRQIIVSRGPRNETHAHIKPKQFLSVSCPNNAIITPIPMMPPSLPSSFHDISSRLNPPTAPSIFSLGGAFKTPNILIGQSKSHQKLGSSTPPPSPEARSRSSEDLLDEHLVTISLILVDKASPEYTEKYSQTKRFIDVDFNCLETKINQQTWVVLLDFLGLGAKVHDINVMAGKEPEINAKAADPDSDQYSPAVVNSEVKLKVKNLSIVLNKPDYPLAEASVSSLNASVSLRQGNFHMKGELGAIQISDLSPSGLLYRERFITLGQQALQFDFFKFGVPDLWLHREYDMRLDLRMASVCYTHTNKFQAEILAFVQHFFQLQDVLGRMRAASAGKQINESAFHNPRLLLNVEAGAPIILIPQSSRTADLLVADLGTMTVRNTFKLAGDEGTLHYKEAGDMPTEPPSTPTPNTSGRSPLSRSTSQTSGIFSTRSAQNKESTSLPDPLAEGLFSEPVSKRARHDPMVDSIYGGLDLDQRGDQDVSDTADLMSEGSSVDPESPRSSSGLNLSSSDGLLTTKDRPASLSSSQRLVLDALSPSSDVTFTAADSAVFASMTETADQSESRRCLLDVMDIQLTDMDLYAAERVEKSQYRGSGHQQDIVFPSCIIQRQGCKLLKEKCVLNLQVERNLEGDLSHAVPDIHVQGALSSVHCCLDIKQYKLIRGLLDHNLGEKFENFKKDLFTHMQDPTIQTVLSGKVWKVISFGIQLNNVSLELLTAHNNDPRGTSLARLDFIRSRLTYDLFSDQSKETDLVSHEITASDTRFRDVATNQWLSVFDQILAASGSTKPDSLHLELHYRASLTGTDFHVKLNNLRLLCSFDWMVALKDFIITKPENPFLADQMLGRDLAEDLNSGPTPSTSGANSRTTSPLTTSGGIITKRGPTVEQTEVPFEFKLIVSETEFVVVENLASLDTNAVILKCTSDLWYRPKAPDKLLTCKLESLEVFSCSLQAEEDTALSIVDPLSVIIELNANPLPLTTNNGLEGLMATKLVEERQLLLEVTCSTMNLRLSYQDLNMFLSIIDSLPKQALQASQGKSPSAEWSDGVARLRELGYSADDCLQALHATNGRTDAAAEWLLESGKQVTEHKLDQQKITTMEINIHTISLCLIDDCQDADVPLIDLNFHSTVLKYEPGLRGRASFQLVAEYYNRVKSGWEPLIEPWRCQAQWRNYSEPEKKLCVEISASDVININVTSSLLELYNLTKDKWTQDYYKQHQSGEQSGMTGARRRHSFTPYSIRNLTGSLVWVQPVTLSPSVVGTDLPQKEGTESSETYMQMSDWLLVPPNDEIPIHFLRKKKIRHKKSDAMRVNQIVVKVEGWQKLTPLSVDKVGVYFRDTLPDTSKPSIIKVNGEQLARVVFDIQTEGTARKVITLRSALMLANKLDEPVELKMDSPIIPGRFEYITFNPGQQKPIPMTFVASRLWVRPSNWTDSHCDQPISWQHVMKPGEIKNSICQCNMIGAVGIYRFCVAVRRESYPEERVRLGLHPVPAHTLLLLPPVTLFNLLPLEINFYLSGTSVAGSVNPGKQCQLPAVDITQNLLLGVSIENFPKCRELIIPPGNNTYRMKLQLLDKHDRPLYLNVGIYSRLGGSLKLTISAPYWLINRSGLPLVFRQDGAHMEAGGQFEEHEIARVVSPLLFSFSDRDCPYLCMGRIGRKKHEEEETLPQWCRSFSLDKEANVCQLHVTRRNRNSPDWIYIIGVETKQGKGKFRETAIVTFSPRFNIDNQSGHTLAIAQRHFTNKEALNDPDSHLTALPGCKMPYHWPRQDLDQFLCVKLLDSEGCNWSGGFKIDADSSFHINMRDSRKSSVLLKVDILLLRQTYNVVFTDPEETPPPFHLENMSEVPVLYYQTKTQEERLRALLQPHTCVPYAWDEPTLEPYLTLSVSNGTMATYSLDKLGEHEQLSYQNFIYITAAITFSKDGSSLQEVHKELVLDCEHDNHVVFRRKKKGRRTQLWRMTSDGMLENEGLSQPLDPRSGSKSRERFVLDIADIALQPSHPVPLALKKADSRREAQQKWSFKNGMLCCSTGNSCVQSIDGVNGLQNGAIAMLGPGPMQGAAVPAFMQMSSMKLHPGSGVLTVRVIMDGPVRVVQITDFTQRMLVSSHPAGEEDWEIYEETLNHKTNEKRKKALKKQHLELDVNLKGGFGISMVNSVPEELLYVSLSNITINYRAHPRAVTFEMTVGNVQVDNQLFNSSRQVVLFVTPTSKRDEVENTPALLISAHKIPNISWNAEIFKHLIISMKKMTMQVEEELLWKVIQFTQVGHDSEAKEKLDQSSDNLQSTLSSYTSVKSQRYYFGNLRINSTCLTLSLLTASGGLPPDLYRLKRSIMSMTFNFEDAKVDFDRFQKTHLFDTKERYLFEIKGHYVKQLKRQFTKILGAVDFLGNPLGLVNDVAEGLSGLVEDSNVSGFAKGIFHGVSNSTAKVAGSLSEGLSTVHMDTKHNTKRQQIRSSAQSSSGQLLSGLKGFGHGMYGGLKSVLKPFEGARQDGVEGFAKGLYTGVTGLVTKPVAGFLDLASGMSGAVRDASRRSSHMQPKRVRKPRCCHGPGGLLPTFNQQQSATQSLLYELNNQVFSERFIAVETVRSRDPNDSLYVLISSDQVFFLKYLQADKDSIIMNIRHAHYKRCINFQKEGRFYVEIIKIEERTSIPYSNNKRPQIRCDKKTVAQKVAQQINYAKYLFDEQKMTLTSIRSMEEAEEEEHV